MYGIEKETPYRIRLALRIVSGGKMTEWPNLKPMQSKISKFWDATVSSSLIFRKVVI